MALYNNGWTDAPEAIRQKAISLARRAVRNAADDAETLGRAAYVLAYCGEDIDAATAVIDRSLRINPSFAYGWHYSGWLRLWAGAPDVAIDLFERSLRLDPRDPKGAILAANGIAHFFARRLNQARTMLLLSITRAPGLGPDAPLSRGLLRAPRPIGRGKNDDQTAARPDAGSAPERGSFARSGAARVLPIGPAAGDE